jgi:D-xylose reductase
MGYAQRDAWGLDYIDLYLIHYPVALKYIEPEKLRYPVRVALLFICV